MLNEIHNKQLDKNLRNSLKKAIIETIAFFSLFDYPLTIWEIWKYCGVSCDLEDIVEIMGKESIREEKNLHINNKNGFYYLAGQQKIIATRLKRYNYTDKKFKRALKIVRIFKFIPWVRGVAIGNIIGAHNLKKEGDIDFFIITAPHRIWVTRFFCVCFVKILGLRPTPQETKDKICLSFFISEDAMNLAELMLFEGKDIYFIYWLAGLVPIYGTDNLWEKFFQENNWLKKYLPNWNFNIFSFRRHVKFFVFGKFFKIFGGGLDKICKKLQLKILSPCLKKIMNKDTRVVINDKVLKLHANDRREEFKNKVLI